MYKIILDAGHGGKDSGAVNGKYSEYKEKVYALDIIKRLGTLLVKQGIEVLYTRTGDTYPTLKERTSFANRNKANYFISVHLNSVNGAPKAKGIETFICSRGGQAEQFANSVQKALISSTGAINRGIKVKSKLVVLKYTNMPAILVETGFISNAEELNKFKTEQYRQKLAQAVCEGICEFLHITVSPIDKKAIKEEDEVIYKTINDVPIYWREDIKSLIEEGTIKGDGKGSINLPSSTAQALVIMLRHERNEVENG